MRYTQRDWDTCHRDTERPNWLVWRNVPGRPMTGCGQKGLETERSTMLRNAFSALASFQMLMEYGLQACSGSSVKCIVLWRTRAAKLGSIRAVIFLLQTFSGTLWRYSLLIELARSFPSFLLGSPPWVKELRGQDKKERLCCRLGVKSLKSCSSQMRPHIWTCMTSLQSSNGRYQFTSHGVSIMCCDNTLPHVWDQEMSMFCKMTRLSKSRCITSALHCNPAFIEFSTAAFFNHLAIFWFTIFGLMLPTETAVFSWFFLFCSVRCVDKSTHTASRSTIGMIIFVITHGIRTSSWGGMHKNVRHVFKNPPSHACCGTHEMIAQCTPVKSKSPPTEAETKLTAEAESRIVPTTKELNKSK